MEQHALKANPAIRVHAVKVLRGLTVKKKKVRENEFGRLLFQQGFDSNIQCNYMMCEVKIYLMVLSIILICGPQ